MGWGRGLFILFPPVSLNFHIFTVKVITSLCFSCLVSMEVVLSGLFQKQCMISCLFFNCFVISRSFHKDRKVWAFVQGWVKGNILYWSLFKTVWAVWAEYFHRLKGFNYNVSRSFTKEFDGKMVTLIDISFLVMEEVIWGNMISFWWGYMV